MSRPRAVLSRDTSGLTPRELLGARARWEELVFPYAVLQSGGRTLEGLENSELRSVSDSEEEEERNRWCFLA